jgi:hypothetical protein
MARLERTAQAGLLARVAEPDARRLLAYSRQRRPSLADVTVKARSPSAGVACADVAAVAELALSELRP